jgi:hypothetical protein
MEQSRFLFIPSPDDIGNGTIFFLIKKMEVTPPNFINL